MKQYKSLVDMMSDIGSLATKLSLYSKNSVGWVNWYQENCRYYEEIPNDKEAACLATLLY